MVNSFPLKTAYIPTPTSCCSLLPFTPCIKNSNNGFGVTSIVQVRLGQSMCDLVCACTKVCMCAVATGMNYQTQAIFFFFWKVKKSKVVITDRLWNKAKWQPLNNNFACSKFQLLDVLKSAHLKYKVNNRQRKEYHKRKQWWQI